MYNIHCHIVLTMIFGVQFPISPSVVLSFFEKFREITHTLKKSIVTTSERQWIHCHSFFSVKMLHILQIKFHCHHSQIELLKTRMRKKNFPQTSNIPVT